MVSEKVENRLCNLIKQYKPSSDQALFSTNYHDVVSKASATGEVDEIEAKLLLQAKLYLEDWVNSSQPDAARAITQWQELYEAGKYRLRDSLFEALLRRFPTVEPGALSWEAFLLNCLDERLVEVLLGRRLIREEELRRLAETRPAQFYQSAALDVAIERAFLKTFLPIWDECVRGKERPAGLMRKEEVLVRCYRLLPVAEGNERMVAYLLDSPRPQEEVFRLLLDDQEAAQRLCRFLLSGGQAAGAPGQAERANRMLDLLVRWVVLCETELQKGTRPRALSASFVLALVRLALLAAVEGAAGSQLTELGEKAARATENALGDMLQKTEQDRLSISAEAVVVLRGGELHRVLQDYLRKLPIGARGREQSPERALRYERYQGSKEVIEQVLLALEEPLDEGGLSDALEVALFNSGVRPLGVVGEHVSFDIHAHEAETPGVVPGDPVIVTRAGRYLGEPGGGLVLTKAKVRLVPLEESP